MRGAIFNSLGDINSLSVLDAFSGSGAISLEAVSRGAMMSAAVEMNKRAQSDIAENIKKLDTKGQITLVEANLYKWLETSDDKYDIIIADPPYDDVSINKLICLEDHLNPKGTLVLSLPPRHELPEFNKIILLTQKNYGDSKLVFYKNNL